MANNLFQKIAEIWLNLKQKTQVVEGNSIYGQSLAAAAIEAFDSNMGNFSTDWLASGEKLNKELVVCTALVDPFVHSQLECICEKSSNVRMRPVEGYRYAKGKYFVFEKIILKLQVDIAETLSQADMENADGSSHKFGWRLWSTRDSQCSRCAFSVESKIIRWQPLSTHDSSDKDGSEKCRRQLLSTDHVSRRRGINVDERCNVSSLFDQVDEMHMCRKTQVAEQLLLVDQVH
uniref:Uncharacterized protein n=1 Tax=Ditylenchus dipsaci TaxID=166011 RepID=A0A915D4N5_9BILA